MIKSPTLPPAELLLGRPAFNGDLQEAAALAHGRRVLVTGAAGSIGWPLSHTLWSARPASLILVDHHEHSLFSLERSLGPATARLSYELIDIRDDDRTARLFARAQPEIVLHLAAAKHVPYGERFPEGAVASNVLATQALLRLADVHHVERFVYPSSDKSVQPPSVYGATKRLAEALVQLSGRVIIRYVNIIGTRGSVVETFTQQILDDQPLSITDERMTRYWISMDEAIWSALQTTRCGAPGEVVMPACGEPVPILETARRLAGWYRPERVPYPITHTGIRPGERLEEVLLSPNEAFASTPTSAGLRSVRTTRNPACLDEVPGMVEELRALTLAGDRDGVAHACLVAAEALQ